MNQASGQFFNVRGKFQGAYVQDSWKATHNLTLNYGVRYEPFIPWHDLYGRMGGFNPTLWASDTHSTMFPLAPAGLQFAGDPGFISNGVANEYDHFMPRIGFAWDVFGNGKTALRGGAGMFYDSRINSTLFNIYSTGSPPFLQAVTLQQTATTPINWANPYGSAGVANPFPSPQPPPNTAPISSSNSWLTFDPYKGFQDPRHLRWNLAVEQQVTGSFSLRAAYVAEHSSHEWQDIGTESRRSTAYCQLQPARLLGHQQLFPQLHYGGQHRRQHQLQLFAGFGRAARALRPDLALQLHLVEGAQRHAVEPGRDVDWRRQFLRVPDYDAELQIAGLRPSGFRSSQHHGSLLRLHSSQVPQRRAEHGALHC